MLTRPVNRAVVDLGVANDMRVALGVELFIVCDKSVAARVVQRVALNFDQLVHRLLLAGLARIECRRESVCLPVVGGGSVVEARIAVTRTGRRLLIHRLEIGDEGLANHRAAVTKDKRRAIENAIKHLRKTNAAINITTVAARRRPTQNRLQTSRPRCGDRPVSPTTHPTDLAPTSRETSIVAALRAQLAAKDKEIKTLKAKAHEQESTIALLYGQLDL